MKYLVLAGEAYYPAGGQDAVYSTDNLEEALLKAKAYLVAPVNGPDAMDGKYDWSEVLDTDTLMIEGKYV